MESRREDGGPLMLQKIAKQYADKGQSRYHLDQSNST